MSEPKTPDKCRFEKDCPRRKANLCGAPPAEVAEYALKAKEEK